MSKACLFISTVLISLCCYTAKAQTDTPKLPFSERTGIKGITTYLHFNTFANDDLLGTNPFFDKRISPEQKQELENLHAIYGESTANNENLQFRKGDVSGSLRSELVLSPFRLSSKP